jgi:hypothetical protein
MIFSSRYPPLIDDELRATLVWSKRTSIDRFRITSWYRHITLSMLAASFLAITAYTERLHDQKGVARKIANTWFG